MALFPLARVPALQAARQGAAQCCLRYGDEVLSWGELDLFSTRRAHALLAAGARTGDLVTLAVPNGVAFYEWMFACWKAGLTPHVVSHRLPAHEMAAILEVARPRLLVSDQPEFVQRFAAVPVAFGREHLGVGPLYEGAVQPWKAMSSGGSSGRPKIILAPLPAAFDDVVPYLLRLPQSGAILSTGPLYHNMPMLAGMRALFAGLQVVGVVKFDPEEILQLIERHAIAWTYFVPTMMMRILRLPAALRQRFDVSSLQVVWHWGAAMPPAAKRAWIEWLGAEKIWELYGGTEGIGTTILNATEWLQRPGSVGRPVVDRLRIQDDSGRVLGPGEVGEIFALAPGGPGSTYQYLGAAPRVAQDGYETLGDYGWLDTDGYLYIADRRTDMIVSGGANIFPAEVEGELMAHPGVEGAVVIGLPHEDLGAAVHAIVQPARSWTGPLDGVMLAAFLADRLARYKIPRSFELVDTPLRDESGKVRRSAWRAARLPATPEHEAEQ